MQYSIIYSVDVPRDISLKPFTPPSLSLWERTEGDRSYEYGYLEGRWTNGKHRKWCAILNEKQFQAFVDKLGLYAENVETMGSLGAPGFGVRVVPAIAFNSHDGDAILSAYVTPFDATRTEPYSDEEWQTLRREIIERYA